MIIAAKAVTRDNMKMSVEKNNQDQFYGQRKPLVTAMSQIS